MDLFTPIVAPEKQHPNFRRILTPDRIGERQVVTDWAENFPDRDNKFILEFQTTFNSSFWEIYLHGLFKAYAFRMDWSKASPDFSLTTPWGEIIVEAVTANAALGALPEWEKSTPMTDNVRNKDFWPLNREAIIRLSSALLAKLKKYDSNYRHLSHVPGKPYIIAVAPFEQPDFQHQYDRPMRALLYDDYVDESAYYLNPEKYSLGPPSVSLGSVTKPNGRSIDLGIFNNDGWSEVSAVAFSCVATWGKTVAMSTHPAIGFVSSAWGTTESGLSAERTSLVGSPSETTSDGFQIFHNPYAKTPLDLQVFRRPGVVQHYRSQDGWVREEYDAALQFRYTHSLNFHAG
jgi:hypothetical protein